MGQSGPNRVRTGSYRVKCGSEVGHVGHPGHVMWVKWVTWATGQVNLSIIAFGATGILGQVFWTTGLLNGCLGL